ncbi:alpha-glucan family phosphorylase [Nitrospira sp. Nam74]
MNHNRSVILRTVPKELEALAALALDLRWTWSHSSDRLWERLDQDIWKRTHNPRAVLQCVPQTRLEALAADPEFKKELKELERARQLALEQPGWFRQHHPRQALGQIAYFSMEFGFGEALPLYAGGLGILAGDMLKTASDLDVPIIGVGLLYQEGYFRQSLDVNGWQIEAYPYNDPISLPIQPVMPSKGEWLRIPLELPGRTLVLRIWQVQIGRVTLYLLDSNDPLNSAIDRGITSKLYDARPEIRLMQEMTLGIGGWRVLEALGIGAEICHLNEGHAAFAVLERARQVMENTDCSFRQALWATRAGNVFTTHTPVAAGFDSFAPEVISRFMQEYVRQLNLSMDEFIALGQSDPGHPEAAFTMATLAMRASSVVNGVSLLHGTVSRRLFQPLFPRWPEDEVPVSYVTNGIHVPSWDSKWTDTLWTQAGGKERWLGSLDSLAKAAQDFPDRELWRIRCQGRASLVSHARQRLISQSRGLGSDAGSAEDIQEVLDPDILTLGFARRFTAYKRPTLLLHDPERLVKLLTHSEHPIQLIVAGKAHPHDEQGKRLIQEFVRFARGARVRKRVIFLEDYEVTLAQALVQGIDVWLNTPRRPWEACGTSGMKVLANGGLNLSALDGWWAEAYSPEVGWAIGERLEHSEPARDAVEAAQLYDLLEQHVVPEFYERDGRGIPARWVARIRASMATLTGQFSSNRMLREYVHSVYLPAAQRVRRRMAHGSRLAGELTAWQQALEQHWSSLRFGEVHVQREGDDWSFQVRVHLAQLDPRCVRVELYADSMNGEPPTSEPLVQSDIHDVEPGWALYRGNVRANRPAFHFTPRLIPSHPEAAIPLEDQHILWKQ